MTESLNPSEGFYVAQHIKPVDNGIIVDDEHHLPIEASRLFDLNEVSHMHPQTCAIHETPEGKIAVCGLEAKNPPEDAIVVFQALSPAELEIRTQGAPIHKGPVGSHIYTLNGVKPAAEVPFTSKQFATHANGFRPRMNNK